VNNFRVITLLILILQFAICPAASKKQQDVRVLLKHADALYETKPKVAKTFAREAYSKALEADDNVLIAQAAYKYACTLYNDYDLQIAMRTVLTASNYCPDTCKILMTNIKTMTGIIYSEMGVYDDAEKTLFKALKMAKSIKNEKLICHVFIALGTLHSKTKEDGASKQFFLKALSLARKHHDIDAEEKILINLGKIGFDYNARLAYLRSGLAIATEKDNQLSIAKCYTCIAECYYYLHQYITALQRLDTSNDYATDIDAKNVMLDNYWLRSRVFKAEKEFDLSLANVEKYVELKDVIEKERHITDYNNTYHESQLLKLRNDYLKGQTEIKAMKYRIFMLIFLAIILTFISIYIVRNNRKKKKKLVSRYKSIKSEINKKDETLTDVTENLNSTYDRMCYIRLLLRSRNVLLENLKDMLRKCYNQDSNATTIELKKINSYISQYLQPMNMDAQEKKIEEDNNDFKKRLQESYPEITKKEMQIAVCLRSNLTSKEIALLLGSQLKTIENHRGRLRKVLGIDPSVNFNEFLQEI
jgi:tetratricopeptide (TPR) repeat protein